MGVCEIYTGPNFILARPPYWVVFLVSFPKEARLALVMLSHSQLSLAIHLPALDNSASFKQTWRTGGAKGGTSAQLRGWEGRCGVPSWHQQAQPQQVQLVALLGEPQRAMHSVWPAGKTPSGEMEAALDAVWRLQQGVQVSAGRGEAKAAGW